MRISKYIYLTLGNYDWCKKGDMLNYGNNSQLIVIKIYKDSWFKKQLRKIGIHLRINSIKAEKI